MPRRRSSSRESRDRRKERRRSSSRRRRYRSRSPDKRQTKSSKKYDSRSSSTSSSDSDYNRRRRSRSSHHKSSKRSRRHRRRSSSRSPTPRIKDESKFEVPKKYILDDTESKIEKAIKAAEAAGLTMCKLPAYEQKEVEVKEDMPTMQDRNILDELNSDSFVQKQFTSSRNKKLPDNIVIDLDAGTVKVPDVDLPQVDSLFHPDLFTDEKMRMEKWIKKMFQFRQKALRGDI